MNRALLGRAFQEAKWLMLGCALTMLGFCWVRVWVVGRIDMSRFQGILEILKPEFENFSAIDFQYAITYPGRVAFTFNEPMVILLMVIWAIARGSDAVSGPLGKGSLEMMLAQPVGRFQYLLSKVLVNVLGVVVIAGSAWLGLHLGVQNTTVKQEQAPIKFQIPLIKIELEIPFTRGAGEPERVPLSDHVDTADFVPPTLNLMALGFFFAGLTTWMSSLDRYRWRTIAIMSGFFVVQLLLRVLSLSWEEQAWLKFTTILSLYEPEVLVSYRERLPDAPWALWTESVTGVYVLGGVGYAVLLMLGGLVGFALAFWTFCRRDLPAPV